jgi:uncharacterized repeat protein (TIGR03803 family)
VKAKTQRLGLALLTAVALVLVGRATAQSFTILRSFGILTNVAGFYPQSTLVQGGDGTLYGTASSGEGCVTGTVFKVQPDGSGFTVLKRFMPSPSGNYPDGANPRAGLTLSGSTLYGTTTLGGSTNHGGTLFKLRTDGTSYCVLHNFINVPDGAVPETGLTLSGSTLYGTTSSGGSLTNGTLFKLKTDGSGYTVLWNFSGRPSDLILSGSTLYGTTASGGALGEGAIFSLNVAPVLNITPIHGAVVLSWDDPAFNLQSSPEVAGPYTRIRSATSPYTNAITGGRQFFRLVTP